MIKFRRHLISDDDTEREEKPKDKKSWSLGRNVYFVIPKDSSMTTNGILNPDILLMIGYGKILKIKEPSESIDSDLANDYYEMVTALWSKILRA
jgi:hypothetical protein